MKCYDCQLFLSHRARGFYPGTGRIFEKDPNIFDDARRFPNTFRRFLKALRTFLGPGLRTCLANIIYNVFDRLFPWKLENWESVLSFTWLMNDETERNAAQDPQPLRNNNHPPLPSSSVCKYFGSNTNWGMETVMAKSVGISVKFLTCR